MAKASALNLALIALVHLLESFQHFILLCLFAAAAHDKAIAGLRTSRMRFKLCLCGFEFQKPSSKKP
jgi:hypothetical protein